ncbi:hypothetical protein EUX98_g9100 [Antrodiella citrinella]|uniref:Uncharacterized protein n=1 Tax=Antrodiella citrinella TaxID=2447956 RepID=A0A4V3XFH8_9APHY|nr:hypothetical protein EUX98_g9100 [Antrodiella citrinella]
MLFDFMSPTVAEEVGPWMEGGKELNLPLDWTILCDSVSRVNVASLDIFTFDLKKLRGLTSQKILEYIKGTLMTPNLPEGVQAPPLPCYVWRYENLRVPAPAEAPVPNEPTKVSTSRKRKAKVVGVAKPSKKAKTAHAPEATQPKPKRASAAKDSAFVDYGIGAGPSARRFSQQEKLFGASCHPAEGRFSPSTIQAAEGEAQAAKFTFPRQFSYDAMGYDPMAFHRALAPGNIGGTSRGDQPAVAPLHLSNDGTSFLNVQSMQESFGHATETTASSLATSATTFDSNVDFFSDAYQEAYPSTGALKFLALDTIPPIPWQRVVSSSGAISSRGPGTNGADLQRQALEAEGVETTVGRTGDLRVNMTTYGWFPEVGTIDIGVPVHDDADEDEEQGGDASGDE